MNLRQLNQKRMSYDQRRMYQQPEIVPIEEPKKEDAFSHISMKAGN